MIRRKLSVAASVVVGIWQTLCGTLAFGVPQLAVPLAVASERIDPKALEILQRSAAIHSKDWNRYRDCRCAGSFDWTSADGTQTWNCDLSADIQNRKVFMSLVTLDQVGTFAGTFERMELVADGDCVAAVLHSERIRPAGCETFVREDNPRGLGKMALHCSLDLRDTIVPRALRIDPTSGIMNHARSVSFDPDMKDRIVVEYDGQTWKYQFDEAAEYRLTQLDSYAPDETLPQTAVTYSYIETAGGFRPQLIIFRQISRPDSSGHHTLSISLNQLDEGCNRADFNISSLQTCAGGRLIDYRRDAVDPVHTLAATTLSSLVSATIAEQVAAVPIRDVNNKPMRPPLTGPKTAKVVILWVSGTGFFLSLAFLIWRRNIKNH